MKPAKSRAGNWGFTVMTFGVAAMLMIGVKSLIGSYVTVGSIAGAVAIVDTVATPRLYPSGAAFAVSVAPITPPAPARFSTTIGCPKAAWTFALVTRATMSVVPPGAKGTTSLTGRLG